MSGENNLNINRIVRVWWLEDVNEWKFEMTKFLFEDWKNKEDSKIREEEKMRIWECLHISCK